MKGTSVFGTMVLVAFGVLAVMGLSVAAENIGNTEDSAWREDVMQAIEDNDFDAWQAAMIGGLTTERFASLVERHQTRTEKRAEQEQRMESINAALEAGNYDAWIDAVSELGGPEDISEMVTEDEFETLVEIYTARQDGDFDTARALMEESGLHMIPGMELGMGEGFGMRGMKRDHTCGFGMGLDFGMEPLAE